MRLARPSVSDVILDFGCGHGMLKQMFGARFSIVGFDVQTKFTEIRDWREADFSILIANHVFYSVSIGDLEQVALAASRKRVQTVVFSDSLDRNINRWLARMAGEPRALEAKLHDSETTLDAFRDHYDLVETSSVFGLTKVYGLALRNSG